MGLPVCEEYGHAPDKVFFFKTTSNGRAGQVGHDDLKKWQNATNTAVAIV
jgi:hypothetical protein